MKHCFFKVMAFALVSVAATCLFTSCDKSNDNPSEYGGYVKVDSTIYPLKYASGHITSEADEYAFSDCQLGAKPDSDYVVVGATFKNAYLVEVDLDIVKGKDTISGNADLNLPVGSYKRVDSNVVFFISNLTVSGHTVDLNYSGPFTAYSLEK